MKTKEDIKASLMAQLRAKGADLDHFTSLIDDYAAYHDLVKQMEQNIKEKGLTYPAISAAGKEYEKENPCVKMLPQYTRSMLAILKELNLTTDKMADEDGDL